MSEQPTTITGIRPGLHISGLGRGEIPTADWLCFCGHHERARGEEGVRQLCAEVRAGHCPHTATAKEAA